MWLWNVGMALWGNLKFSGAFCYTQNSDFPDLLSHQKRPLQSEFEVGKLGRTWPTPSAQSKSHLV